MNGGQLPTNQLHDINWGAPDHASRAPQLMSCNYYVCVCFVRSCQAIQVFFLYGWGALYDWLLHS